MYKRRQYMKRTGEKCNLSEVKVGQRAKVLKLNEENRTFICDDYNDGALCSVGKCGSFNRPVR